MNTKLTGWDASLPRSTKEMKAILTRSSVCAGDDVDAPHWKEIELKKTESLKDILSELVASDYLPSISGGRATWSVVSERNLGIIAQQWSEPKGFFNHPLETLDYDKTGRLKIHFNYHEQKNPDEVFDILWSYRNKGVEQDGAGQRR